MRTSDCKPVVLVGGPYDRQKFRFFGCRELSLKSLPDLGERAKWPLDSRMSVTCEDHRYRLETVRTDCGLLELGIHSSLSVHDAIKRIMEAYADLG